MKAAHAQIQIDFKVFHSKFEFSAQVFTNGQVFSQPKLLLIFLRNLSVLVLADCDYESG